MILVKTLLLGGGHVDGGAAGVFKFSFNTFRFSSGASYTLAGTPSLYLRVNGGAKIVAGDLAASANLALAADFNDGGGAVTGENQVGFGYDDATLALADGDDVEVFATGTVDSVAVTWKIAHFAMSDGSLSTQTKADINAEADTAISDYFGTAGDGLTALPQLPAALGADGFVKASLWGAMGTALTETAGQIAAAITKFFNKAAPTGTVNSLPDAVAGAAGGVAIVGSAMTMTGLDAAALQQIVDDLENNGRLDVLIDAIKAKTDQLTFSATGFVDSNVMEVNDNGGLTGDGDTPVAKA